MHSASRSSFPNEWSNSTYRYRMAINVYAVTKTNKSCQINLKTLPLHCLIKWKYA